MYLSLSALSHHRAAAAASVATKKRRDNLQMNAASPSSPKRTSAAADAVHRLSALRLGQKHNDKVPLVLVADHSATNTTVASSLLAGKKPNTAQLHRDGNVLIDWSRIDQLEHPKGPFFRRHNGAVVATKVVGPEALDELKQSLCLFTAAYNRHLNYDIVVFTTLPWHPSQVRDLQDVVSNANLTVALEGPPLKDQVAKMRPDERDYLYDRCRVSADETLTYEHWCTEQPNSTADNFFDVKLSYAWQAEFRARHVWHAPALAPYKYMLWIDSDAFCTQPWESDPVSLAVESDMVLLFDHFPGDYVANPDVHDRIATAYPNRTLCDITLVDGKLKSTPCHDDDERKNSKPHHELPWLGVVHGFFHVTNLDFYRSRSVTQALEVLIGPKRFSREWDDQVAVTLPAVLQAPDRTGDLRSRGINLQVWHNGYLDGQEDERPRKADDNFLPWWEEVGKGRWDVGKDVCGVLCTSEG
jgi:hypothetical protein